jgi:pSer/pThr/pTyr-binding forkhead associated (FHA) protein
MSSPKLIALFKTIHPAEYTIETEVCTIGRSSACHIIIPVGVVSRCHAIIEQVGSNYILTDLNSAHGTFVNGRQIREPYLLKDQDLIGLSGNTPVLRFEDPDSTLAGARLGNPLYLVEL